MPMTADVPGMDKKLRRLRTARGLTQMQLAVKAGVALSIVTQIEQGVTADPRRSTLLALARALGVSLDELAGGQAADAPADA